MRNVVSSRTSIALGIILFYVVPILGISAYSIGLMTLQGSWSIFSIGIAAASFGSCALLFLFYHWDNQLRQQLASPIKPVPQPIETPPPPILEKQPDPEKDEELLRITQERLIQEAVMPWQAKHERLIAENAQKDEELHHALEERKNLQTQILTIRGELDSYRDKMRMQLLQEQNQNVESQKIIEEQRSQLEAQQHLIVALEVKEKELAYEIKTLVSLTNYEAQEPPRLSVEPIHNPTLTLYEPKKSSQTSTEHFPQHSQASAAISPDIVSRQLSHFIDTAANIATGQQLHGIPSHLYDLPNDNYALELRRLCENLNMENRYIVLLHSPRDKKLLFVNDYVKILLGWTPDKFIQQFPEIIINGMEELQNPSNLMSGNREAICSLQAKTSSNESIPLRCQFKAINAGTFRNHNICILYPYDNGLQ